MIESEERDGQVRRNRRRSDGRGEWNGRSPQRRLSERGTEREEGEGGREGDGERRRERWTETGDGVCNQRGDSRCGVEESQPTEQPVRHGALSRMHVEPSISACAAHVIELHLATRHLSPTRPCLGRWWSWVHGFEPRHPSTTNEFRRSSRRSTNRSLDLGRLTGILDLEEIWRERRRIGRWPGIQKREREKGDHVVGEYYGG